MFFSCQGFAFDLLSHDDPIHDTKCVRVADCAPEYDNFLALIELFIFHSQLEIYRVD